MFVLLLWSVLILPQMSPSVDSAFTLSITTQSMPAAVGVPQVTIDGRLRSVLPAVVELNFPLGETKKIDIWGDQFQHYSFSLVRSAAGVQLTQYVDSCQKERATPSMTVNSHSVNVVMAFHTDGANCSSSAATVLPNARIKVRFESSPQDTMLYFKNASSFTSTALPAVLSLGYSTAMRLVQFTVFFKKAGYYDCAKDFQLNFSNGTFELEIDRTATPIAVGDIPDAAAPKVTCDLKKVP
jgi:hypothetical protein